MEKEICVLKNFRNILDATTDTDCTDLDNAIKTIEYAMKPKTCEGCVYEAKDGVLNVECAFCLRNSNDNFEPKEQWDDVLFGKWNV